MATGAGALARPLAAADRRGPRAAGPVWPAWDSANRWLSRQAWKASSVSQRV